MLWRVVCYRRGSSASLTLDLGTLTVTDSRQVPSPPQEWSVYCSLVTVANAVEPVGRRTSPKLHQFRSTFSRTLFRVSARPLSVVCPSELFYAYSHQAPYSGALQAGATWWIMNAVKPYSSDTECWDIPSLKWSTGRSLSLTLSRTYWMPRPTYSHRRLKGVSILCCRLVPHVMNDSENDV